MILRGFVVGVAAGMLAAAPLSAAAGPPGAYSAARTAWGKPDLSGTWTNATLTRLERDPKLGARLVLTPAEAAAIEGKEAAHVARQSQPTDPNAKVTDLPEGCRDNTGVNCGYNVGWTDPGSTVMRVHGEPRASFITFPADGRVPPSLKGPAPVVRRSTSEGGPADNPEGRSLGERCILAFGTPSGPVMGSQLYNNNYQFLLTKDAFVILVEMVHDARIVRLDRKEHLRKSVRPWMGDSIGWWEGNTLVAETTNFNPRQPYRGADENLKVTERFTRTAPDHILYQFKVEDPTIWAQPWGGEYEFSTQKGQVYEYACHEGNYALPGILAGAREDEAGRAGSKSAAAGGGAP
jgi:hypothetical protein